MLTFVIVCVGWIISVCCHEFGHALTAYYGGDYTVKDKGYLTFNPLRYTNPVYSLLMPLIFLLLGGIGLPGGAVYINDNLLRSRGWRTGVSLAGPAMSVLVALALWAPMALGWMPREAGNVISCAVAFLIFLQVSAVVLNLLPVPPLDGFHALSPWLPVGVGDAALRHGGAALLVLFIVLWNVPAASNLFWGTVLSVTDALNIDRAMIGEGLRDFRFWVRR